MDRNHKHTAISVKHLSKTYAKNKVVAVNNVSFEVLEGELFGLIGPDGAGKSSIFRMLTTLILPDSGSAKVTGFDSVKDYKEIRKSVGYMPGDFSLYPDLTVEENIHFFANLFGTTLEENYDLVADIYRQIEPFKKRRAGNLSGGMKQKLALCCALIHKPKILFLDEPTTGVDAVSRKEFWAMLKQLKSQGMTIMVSTPYMDEARLCDQIALIQKGEILSIETPEKTMENYPNLLFAVKSESMYPLLKALEKCELAKNSYAFGEYAHLVIDAGKGRKKSEDFKNEIIRFLNDRNIEDVVIKPITATVEDCFIHLMQDQEGLQFEKSANG